MNTDEHGRDHDFDSDYATLMEPVNFSFRQGHHHKFAWDYATMQYVLERYGFTSIRQSEYGSSRLPELAIDMAERASESLYVEAEK